MTEREFRDIPQLRALGGSGIAVSAVAVGTSALAGMPSAYGYDVPEERAVATVEQFLRSGLNLIDISNEYGAGEGERRVGTALARSKPLSEDLVVATKADPSPGARTFDAARVRESFLESTDRLGLSYIPIYHLHDPERFDFDSMTAPGGALDGMRQLKEEGLVGLIGVAGGNIEQMYRYVDTGVFDILLNHNQYNLIDRSANALITHAVDAGLYYFNAAPYASGMFAKAAEDKPRFQYGVPSAQVTQLTEWLRAECAAYGVPLAALALQFSTGDPRITSTIVGVSRPARVDDLVTNARLHIPAELWSSVLTRLEIARA